MKKKKVTVLAIEYSKRVCDPQPEFIDRMDVRGLVMSAYRSGYNKAHSEQAKQSPWISVKERLPNNDENIFYTNHLSGALGVGFYVDEKWYQAYTGDDIYGITHWMPIPKFNVKQNRKEHYGNN